MRMIKMLRFKLLLGYLSVYLFLDVGRRIFSISIRPIKLWFVATEIFFSYSKWVTMTKITTNGSRMLLSLLHSKLSEENFYLKQPCRRHCVWKRQHETCRQALLAGDWSIFFWREDRKKCDECRGDKICHSISNFRWGSGQSQLPGNLDFQPAN